MYVDYVCPSFHLRDLFLVTVVHRHSMKPKPEQWTSWCLALVEQPCVSQLRMGLMDQVASGNGHIGALLPAPQCSSSDNSDSFTTSAVFFCPNCGLHVYVRHRICHSCHRELDFCGLEDACEQELGASSGSSDGTVIDSSLSGSSSPAVDADDVVQFE
jgi:predicted RNA-binding Zn-ribbon protein involved in translation (DUF1610 family)